MRRWLRWFAVALIVGMQAEAALGPFSSSAGARRADWLDLLTPYAILGTATMVLLRAGAGRREWTVLGIGGITYTLGFGLHLAANSISAVHVRQLAGTAAPGGPATATDLGALIHLWDEVVSHYLGYTGLFLVLVAVTRALRPRGLAPGAIDHILGALVGVTLFNNYVEGGTPYLGVVLMLVAVVAGVRWRPAPISRLVLEVAGTVLVLLLAWGLYWVLAEGRSFPQFSELGWI